MRIILDGLGGEEVERESPKAIHRFLFDHPDVQLDIATSSEHLKKIVTPLSKTERARINHLEAKEKIQFDEKPLQALRQKKQSSIQVAMESMDGGDKEALVSFGHTGATVAAARLHLGLLDGVDRAGLAAIVPNRKDFGLLMDVGANLDCRANHLLQYAQMADLYCSQAMGVKQPKIGLLNIGEEEGKGDQMLIEAFELCKASHFSFVGNVEGGQIFDGTVDAVITSGITGNMILKSAESLANVLFESLKAKLVDEQVGSLSRGKTHWIMSSLAQRHNPDSRGACRLLGVKGLVLIGHGNAGTDAIYSSLVHARLELESGLQAAIGKRLSAKS